jgi:hypothetical protein
MKKFQSINETMFSNSIVSSIAMSVMLGGKETATGAGGKWNGPCTGGTTWTTWTSDSCDEDGSCSYTGYKSECCPNPQ